MTPALIIDDDPTTEISAEKFLEINDEFTPEEIAAVRSLQVNETLNFGGGAFATTAIKRIR